MQEIKFGSRIVKEFTEPLIIADVGSNFNGSIDIAKEMILKAKKAGIDVVKFQSWTKESLLTKGLYENKPAELEIFGHNRLEDLLDYLSLTEEDHYELKAFCDNNDIMFSSTPVSCRHVDMLADLDVPFFKVASCDSNQLSFIKHIAEKGKPVILSTGLASLEELVRTVETIHSTGNKQLILLHCISLYPPKDEFINLNTIDWFRDVFGCPVGYSDHTIGTSIPLASVVKGVPIIEKHYTLDKSMPGWDHAVSGTPEEFEIIVKESKRITKALGTRRRNLSKQEVEKRHAFRRSIVAARNIKKGNLITENDITFKRPGIGIAPDQVQYVVGRILKNDIKADTLLNYDQLV
jgi:N-acetylneuraminate synthase